MTRKANDPGFVKLEDMTAADIRWNIERLRNEAANALKHGDALEQYKDSIGEVENGQK